MKYLVVFIILSLHSAAVGQTEQTYVVDKRFEYPVFLRPDNSNALTTEIILYNALNDSSQFDICYFDSKSGNFSTQTFYVRKTSRSDEIGLISTVDYYRISEEIWREVTIGSSGPSQRIVQVIPRIVERDTLITYNPSTFDEIRYIIGYKAIE